MGIVPLADIVQKTFDENTNKWRVDASVSIAEGNYTLLLDYNSGSSPVYIGEAEPGTSTSEAKWRIRKIEYDANGNPISVKWADGTNSFTKVWDDRATYTYS